MKYTNRKKTPLKWHHILTFAILPLLIMARVYAVLGLTSELMGFHLPFVTNYLELLLSATGVVISSLGNWFWPVVGFYFIEIAALVWLIFIWIGMLRWKEKDRVQWLIYLSIELLAGMGAFYLIYQRLVVNEYYIIVMPLLVSIHLLPPYLASHLSLFLAVLISVLLAQLIFFLMNLVYYHKRRPLFAAYYTAPVETEQKEAVQEETVAQPAEESTVILNTVEKNDETQLSSTESDTTADVSVEPDQQDHGEIPDTNAEKDSDSSENEQQENTSAQNSDDPDHLKEESLLEEKAENNSEEMLFCPNCGAKLTKYDQNYCTHCGAKLR